MSLMGVDIGTTGVKAVVFDLDGRRISSAYEEYPLLFPSPGFAELDSMQVMEAAMRVIASAAGQVAATDPVGAIGVASQGEAFTPLAADGTAIGNGMVSSDTRAAGLVQAWSERLGREFLYQTTGHTPYPMYSLFKLAWLRENRPQVWAAARRFLFFEDLLIFLLTGQAVTDYTMAARSMLFDVRAKRWSEPILKALDLPPEKLPQPVPSGTPAGEVKPDIARRLGLSPRAVVVTGGHDQPCGGLGCGAIAPGVGSYSIGTSECICPTLARPIFSPDLMAGNLATYPHVLADRYTTVAFSLTGGSVLKWLRDTVTIEEAAAARAAGRDPYEFIIAAASDRPSPLVFLSHLGPTGTPHFDPDGAGVLFGIRLDTTRGDIIRAALEGITFEMRWNLWLLSQSGLEMKELRAVGGGARSRRWLEIKADILGVPICVMAVTEATCMGAAILAGAGMGLFSPADAAARWARPGFTCEPRPEFAPAYAERFEIYKDLYRCTAAARAGLRQIRRS
jgi:xylulokinase